MIRKKVISSFYIFVLAICNSLGQFQTNNNPLRLNPSFAGAIENTRITSSIMLPITEPIFNGMPIRTYHVSADRFIKPLKTGFGLYWEGGNVQQKYDWLEKAKATSFFGLIIAPKYTFANKIGIITNTISPSLDFSFGSLSSKYNYHGLKGTNNQPILSIRLGLLFNTQNYFYGVSLRYLNIGAGDYTQTNAHIGYTFGKSKSGLSFSPVISVVHILDLNKSKTFDKRLNGFYIDAINLNFRFRKFIFGGGYPNAMLGFQTSSYRLACSFNYGKSTSESLLFNYYRKAAILVSMSFTLKKTNRRL